MLLAMTAAGDPVAKTPIKHLVVIFQENHSFDVYFATYPTALNPVGQPAFQARRGTPSVNGLTPTLIERNPNSSKPSLFVAKKAIVEEGGHSYAWVVDSKGVLSRRLIETVVTNDELARVEKGLSAGDIVVISPSKSLRVGDEVKLAD